ncbi:MAG TPA: hypothetical protein VLQ65_08785 [Saliniramus sp.]|nr:hypothetical protein [Saliniramus sp.]
MASKAIGNAAARFVPEAMLTHAVDRCSRIPLVKIKKETAYVTIHPSKRLEEMLRALHGIGGLLAKTRAAPQYFGCVTVRRAKFLACQDLQAGTAEETRAARRSS